MKEYKNLSRQDYSRFSCDITELESELLNIVNKSRFLVIGGAGSIGQSVVKQIFKRHPKSLHVVDLNENNLVELVRDIRSSLGYISGDFRTFVLDCNSVEFNAAIDHFGPYDYVLNLSALKHVRSEKDPYTLMRMIRVNILNTLHTLNISQKMEAKKYFCVSTDKATNPVNMMGSSKRIMELFLMKESKGIDISTARFANVAFSDGSLLSGFNHRFEKKQPITAPNNIRRYFINLAESGELCLLSCIFGSNRDIFFPKIDNSLELTLFTSIAEEFLKEKGFDLYLCSSEEEARKEAKKLIIEKKWPCFFFESDTTGEKEFEEFYTESDKLDLNSFQTIGVIKNDLRVEDGSLDNFLRNINNLLESGSWDRHNLVNLFKELVPDFEHLEKGKFLDEKM